MKVDDQEEFGKANYKGGSPLALENAKMVFAKNRTLLEGLQKKSIFEENIKAESLLNENQIIEE